MLEGKAIGWATSVCERMSAYAENTFSARLELRVDGIAAAQCLDLLSSRRGRLFDQSCLATVATRSLVDITTLQLRTVSVLAVPKNFARDSYPAVMMLAMRDRLLGGIHMQTSQYSVMENIAKFLRFHEQAFARGMFCLPVSPSPDGLRWDPAVQNLMTRFSRKRQEPAMPYLQKVSLDLIRKAVPSMAALVEHLDADPHGQRPAVITVLARPVTRALKQRLVETSHWVSTENASGDAVTARSTDAQQGHVATTGVHAQGAVPTVRHAYWSPCDY